VDQEQMDADRAPANPAVEAALTKLDALDQAPLEQHAEIFETVRSDLRSALDAD
jgi:hypothetical protein